MLRVGDKVSLVNNMHLTGIIKKIKMVDNTSQWLVGGTSTQRMVCEVHFSNGEIKNLYSIDLRKEYEY